MQHNDELVGWRERLREGSLLYLYITRIAVTLFIVIPIVGLAKSVTLRIMGDDIDLVGSMLSSLKLGTILAIACIAAAVVAAIAGHLFWRYERIKPWALGLAASAGLWGSMALIRPNGIQSSSDVVALIIAWAVFGALFGYLIYRWQEQLRQNVP